MIPIKTVEELISKHSVLEKDLSSGKIDKKLFAEKSKEYSDLNEILNSAKQYLSFEKTEKDLEKILSDSNSDEEMKNLAKEELQELLQSKKSNEKKLKLFLLPKDDADKKNAIIEIRAGTGGLEASLFAADLFKMYEKVSNKKKLLVLTLDAFGDFINYSVFQFNNHNSIKRIIKGGNSIIARLYRYTTLLLGFKPDEHEYKIMGMAPYAKKKYYEDLLNIFKKFQSVKGTNFFNKKMPKDLYFEIKEKIEGFRFDSVCGALQEFTEYLCKNWLVNLKNKYNTKNFMLAGGVAMNVKNNLNITNIKGIKNFFVPLAPDDTSLSMGAAYYYNSIILKNRSYPIKNAYLGPKVIYSNIKNKKNKFVIKTNNINEEASKLLHNGKILGRISGRAEFGARALGNRSIIANPKNMISIKKINETIKNRDFWMPFAASVLEIKAKEYFKLKDKHSNYEYMTKCVETTLKGQDLFQAAIHPFDKTCRPQIILKGTNPNYEDLIKKFGKKSGVYGLLNTSFNLHGYPIVNDLEDALNIFENSNLDALIINEKLLIKN